MLTNAITPYVILYHENIPFYLPIDKRASISFIKEDNLPKGYLIDSKTKVKVKGISGPPFYTLGTIKLKFSQNNFHGNHTFHVLPADSSSQVEYSNATQFKFNTEIIKSKTTDTAKISAPKEDQMAKLQHNHTTQCDEVKQYIPALLPNEEIIATHVVSIRVGRHFATLKGVQNIEYQEVRRYTPRSGELKSENRLSIAFVSPMCNFVNIAIYHVKIT